MNQQRTIDASISWKLLLRRLQKEKAILLIGPEVIMASQQSDQALKEKLQDYIQQDLEGILDDEDLKRIEYYSEDGFFFLEDNYRLEVVESVQEFYKKQQINNLYRQLAEIPFHLTLSLSPDKLLGQAFEALNLPYHFHFYDKTSYNTSLDDEKLNFKPSKSQRLIYNIFGSVDNEDSMILSYDDLFEFLQRIFNNYKLPKTVEESILAANCFVFIGFNYSKWYLKLLLRLMKMHEKVRKVYGMDTPSTKDIETFFVNEFDMNFTQMDAVSFIEALYQKCQEADMLIKPNLSPVPAQKLPPPIVKQAKSLMANSLLKEAFDLLTAYCQKSDSIKAFCNELSLIKARYHQLEQDNRDGVLLHQNYVTTLNKIRRDLSNLINEFS